MYLGLLILSRFFLKRESGSGSLSDLLVVVLLADAAQNGMAGEYKTITDGLILVSTILFWSFLLDWLAYYIKPIAYFVHPRPLTLIKNGKVIRKNMKAELFTHDELMKELRVHGIENIEQVRVARVEGDGQVTVLK